MSADASIRAREATTRATALLARNVELAARSTAIGALVERNRLELAERRMALHGARRSLAATLARNTSVEVTGTIDGVDVAATWTDGHLVGSPELIRRAEMLVAMHEVLVVGDDPDGRADTSADGSSDSDGEPVGRSTRTQPRLTASLAGPPSVVALTLMRACTLVRSVDLPVES